MSARLSRLKSWLRAITHRHRLESQIDEEVLFHLEARAADLTQQGLSPREAIRRARIEFGAIPAHKDAMRHSLNLRWWDDLWADLRYAARILRKSPGFTAIAVASLALAIGANTTIFSYANQMLFVRLGVPHAEQLRMFRLTGDRLTGTMIEGLVVGDDQDSYGGSDGQIHLGVFPYPAYLQLRKKNHSVEDIFAFQQISNIPIVATGSPQVAKVELVSGNFYAQMQVKPQLGRPIEPADDVVSGAGAVAVISDSFWHSNYGGSPGVLGKTIRVASTPMTIIGINPPAFTGPDGAETTTTPQVFLPFSMTPAIWPAFGTEVSQLQAPQRFWIHLMARARPDVSKFQAEAALNVAFNAAFRGTASIDKDATVPRLSLVDGSHGATMAMRTLMQPLYVLVGLAALLLLLACANIANLMLARASFRQREMSARMALGATRSRILRQVLTESLLLSVIGGVAGLFLGYISRNLIPWLMRTGWDGGEMPVGFDWRVFGFASAVTLLTAIFFGLAPAWRSTNSEISAALKEGARTATRKHKAWSGKAIVGFQVALSTLLVISAVFFLRTLVNLNSVDPGFHTQNLLLFDISAPKTRYPDRKGADLHRRTEEALAAVPGVQSVSVTNMPLLAGAHWDRKIQIQGSNLTDTNAQTMTLSVGPQFFSVMSIPILSGRGFTAEDTATSIPVSVVNQELVREFFPDTNPIGKRFRSALKGPSATRWIEIVGVCADTRYSNMREPVPPIYFDLDLQSLGVPSTVSYIVRSPLKPDTLLPSLRSAVQQIDPDLPLSNIRTQEQQIAASMQQERMFASFTTGFGLLALALACVGIYGIMAYTVSQRTNEIGIRLALGAHRAQVRAMVLRQATRLAILGVIIGVATSLALSRLIKSMLYGLRPADPISIACAATLLLAVALIASWLPAFRASRVEPMEALRHE
jgi:predicted permease